MCADHLPGLAKLHDSPLLVSEKRNVYAACVSACYWLPAMPESPYNNVSEGKLSKHTKDLLPQSVGMDHHGAQEKG
jgi:hypothetical protein